MGIETIRKATDTFKRKQRRCLDQFDEPNLFRGAPQLSVALVATPMNHHTFKPEQECRLIARDGQLFVVRGVSIVGHIDDPPASVRDLLNGPCPSAFGRVSRTFELTDKAEIALE